jgi:hypothetical protein
MTRVLVLLSVSLLAPACHRAAPGPGRPAHDKPAARKGQGRAPETLLYVDGVPRASISYGELTVSGPQPLCEYLGAVGVPCPAVRALHLYASGGAVTPLGDLTKARLVVEPGTAPLIGGVALHAVAVYLGKAPPALPVEGIPYLDEPVRGGTRINVDGRLAARLKRNQIEGELLEQPGGYALADYLARAKLATPRAVELVTADDQVVRVPDRDVAGLLFDAEPEKHGQMSFRFAGRAVSVVAVNLYVAAAPPLRELARATPSLLTRQAGFTAGCSVVW